MIDLQVNGYAGVDFNGDALDVAQVRRACDLLREDAVTGILATVITDSFDAMIGRLRRLVAAREADTVVAQTILGIHIEGPFLNSNPGFAGAHPADAMMDADVDSMKRLLDAADGLTRIVTLAPECDPGMTTTAFLAGRGVIVSAGHCDPEIATLEAAIDHGLSMFTHLGNGCPAQLHRHGNIIQRVLSLSDRLDIGFIADGVHIPDFVLRNQLRCVNPDRCFFVTDAISAARLGPGDYTLGRWRLKIGEDGVARSPDGSHFVGSTSTFPRIRSFAESRLGLSTQDVVRLTVTNPRRILKLD